MDATYSEGIREAALRALAGRRGIAEQSVAVELVRLTLEGAIGVPCRRCGEGVRDERALRGPVVCAECAQNAHRNPGTRRDGGG
jgi:hypothetical protein